jgi:hypothetical protein
MLNLVKGLIRAVQNWRENIKWTRLEFNMNRNRSYFLAQIKLKPNQNRNSLTKEFVQLETVKIKVSQESV